MLKVSWREKLKNVYAAGYISRCSMRRLRMLPGQPDQLTDWLRQPKWVNVVEDKSGSRASAWERQLSKTERRETRIKTKGQIMGLVQWHLDTCWRSVSNAIFNVYFTLFAVISVPTSQTTVVSGQTTTEIPQQDDDDDDWDEGDDSLESDDDGRVYKNPRNSPSTECPRDEEQATLLGQKCLRKCSSDEDCKSKKKKCLCDGVCGNSCIKPGESAK